MWTEQLNDCGLRSIRVINGKEEFRFYISYCLKIWQNFEMEVGVFRGEGGRGEY